MVHKLLSNSGHVADFGFVRTFPPDLPSFEGVRCEPTSLNCEACEVCPDGDGISHHDERSTPSVTAPTARAQNPRHHPR